jgi:hypothetical protein
VCVHLIGLCRKAGGHFVSRRRPPFAALVKLRTVSEGKPGEAKTAAQLDPRLDPHEHRYWQSPVLTNQHFAEFPRRESPKPAPRQRFTPRTPEGPGYARPGLQ